MCVALPGRVLSVGEPVGVSIPAVVRFGDADRKVDLAMVPEAGEGDYVVVHSGYAITIVPAASAEATLALMADSDHR